MSVRYLNNSNYIVRVGGVINVGWNVCMVICSMERMEVREDDRERKRERVCVCVCLYSMCVIASGA